MNDLTIQELSNSDVIRSRIFTIRGVQVMLDRDLAELYGVATKVLNQAVKRNIERFPERYMFQLNKDDVANMRSQIVTGSSTETSLRSQIVTLNKGQGQHLKYMPYAFTEQGIAMLSAILKSETAIQVSLKIMDAFVAMRKALASIAPLLARIEATDRRQIADQAKNDANQERNEERFKLILDAMQDKKFPPQKVFFDGQVYDAFEQMKKFVRMAKKELIIIDPYFADSVLPLIAQKRKDVEVVVIKNSRNKLLHDVDVAQFNAQYANSLTVKVSDKFHDRFLVIDKTTLIHVGASLNHLGKKCFAFSSLDKSNIPDILAKI
ncbi:MAG: ORF6N domain-containing protein [Kiritimatiellae bacterium]|nr:ORF6N domain-containing protein [Kiritimatiellia bacterium]